MKIVDSLKKLRESKGYSQQQMADHIHAHRTGYSKMENNQQEVPIDCLILIAKNFSMSVDNTNSIPAYKSIADKAAIEQLQLINKLDDEEKNILLKLIETFVYKKDSKITYSKILLRFRLVMMFYIY